MYCLNCGAKLPEDAKICPNCSALIEQSEVKFNHKNPSVSEEKLPETQKNPQPQSNNGYDTDYFRIFLGILSVAFLIVGSILIIYGFWFIETNRALGITIMIIGVLLVVIAAFMLCGLLTHGDCCECQDYCDCS